MTKRRRRWKTRPALRGPFVDAFHDANRLSARLNLYVLVEGKPEAPAWLIYSRDTGEAVATYTPADRVLRIDERRVTCADAREALRRASGHFDVL